MSSSVLLIQIRDFDEIADHEHECFSNVLGRADSIDLEKINVYENGIEPDDALKEFDGLMIGGSHHDPKDDFPNRSLVEDIIEKSIENKKPFLGVCYGLELLVDVLGGKIEKDKEKGSFGTEKIKLTKRGKQDDLLSGMPEEFFVQEAHEWFVSDLPDNLVSLAYSKDVPYQSIKVKNRPVYGVQFHPEFDNDEILKRMVLNEKRQRKRFDNRSDILTGVKHSPHSFKILDNFLTLL